MLTTDDLHSSPNLISFPFNHNLPRRIVGRYKHFLIIQLQTEIHRRTGSWLPIGLLWQRLDELYDLEGLDEMVRAFFLLSRDQLAHRSMIVRLHRAQYLFLPRRTHCRPDFLYPRSLQYHHCLMFHLKRQNPRKQGTQIIGLLVKRIIREAKAPVFQNLPE